MTFKKILAFTLLLSSFSLYSCLKNDVDTSQPIDNTQDPSLEKAQIDAYAASKGYQMVTDTSLKGFQYQVLEYGDTANSRINLQQPIATLKYEGRLMNDSIFDNSTKTSGVDSVKMQIIQQVGNNVYYSVIQGFGYGILKIGAGGHIRIITPSRYGYGANAQTNSSGKVVIPANSPLFFDIYLKRVGVN